MTAPAEPAVTAAYMDDLSRVRVAWQGFPADAVSATVERSIDGIRWSRVRGGDPAPSWQGTGHLDDCEFTAGRENAYRVTVMAGGKAAGPVTVSVVPVLGRAWLKVPARPALNRPVTVTDISAVTRPARTATFDVVGRTLPVAISDVQGSRRFTVTVMTESPAQADDLENSLLSGLPLFLQACDPASAVPTAYVAVGEIERSKQSHRGRRRFFALPMTEVAAPALTVWAGTYTYADVLADYATYAGVLADAATYAALADKISTAEVVVP